MQEIILKKVLLGGYDCFDVMNHINAWQTKINRTKKDSDNLDELNREIKVLEAQLAAKEDEIAELERAISEHDNGRRNKQPSATFIKQTADYADSYIEAAHSLEKSVKELTAEQIGDAGVKIGTLRKNIERISGMVGELFVLLSDLKTEYTGINESYAEIVSESSKLEHSDEPKIKKTTAKRNTSRANTKSASKSKKTNDDVLKLLNQTEEKYKSI